MHPQIRAEEGKKFRMISKIHTGPGNNHKIWYKRLEGKVKIEMDRQVSDTGARGSSALVVGHKKPITA